VILVTVGTNEATFDRLLRTVEGLAAQEEVVVQHGPSAVRPRGATCREFMPFDELVATMRRARVVVTHAGVGSVMTALLAGKRPIVVPRLRRHGEAVDDHQLAWARRLEEGGLAVLVEEPALLGPAVEHHAGDVDASLRPDQRLVDELRGFLAGCLDTASAA
jgi:exopolysaccharide biosynthesis glucuronosyltransferase PssE